jgi:hypothetical protein
MSVEELVRPELKYISYNAYSHSTSQNTSTRVYYITASGPDEGREIHNVIAC